MEITAEQFARIEQYLLRRRGNVSHENLNVINAILFVAENACKWRALPKRFGKLAYDLYPHESLSEGWRAGSAVCTAAARAVHPHQNRGGESGQHDYQCSSRWRASSKKNGPQAIGKSRGGWSTKVHMVAASARCAIGFSL